MKTAIQILSEVTGLDEASIMDDNGEFPTKKAALKAMEEYANQFFDREEVLKSFNNYCNYMNDYKQHEGDRMDFETFMQINYPEK